MTSCVLKFKVKKKIRDDSLFSYFSHSLVERQRTKKKLSRKSPMHIDMTTYDFISLSILLYYLHINNSQNHIFLNICIYTVTYSVDIKKNFNVASKLQ